MLLSFDYKSMSAPSAQPKHELELLLSEKNQ